VLRGATQDIYSEGLQMPIVKIFKAGTQDQELTDIIRTNVRFPGLAMGDFRAQIASIRTGERRFLDLLSRYGRDAVLDSIERIYDQSERLARASVATIPDGVYEAESFMDDDGATIGQPIPIKVRVVVDGEHMTVDLSEVSRQVGGYFNSGATAGRSAAEVAFKCLTSPLWLPINHGSFRPLKVVLPPGRVISAQKPAATRMWMTIPMTVVDTVFRAIAPAIPERTIAGHHADLCVASTYGVDPKTGKFFFGFVGPAGGGWGAKYDSDGMNGVICLNDGDTHNGPVEASEAKAPIVVEEHSLIQDSGGPGKFRGGLGIHRPIRSLVPTSFNSQTERTQCAPWGLFGGVAAAANRVYVIRSGGRVEQPSNGKMVGVQLAAGDSYCTDSGGGGGFGDPFERPPDNVHQDVLQGYVSLDSAERDYGVVIVNGSVDHEATRQLRAPNHMSSRNHMSSPNHMSS
jgi:N-methylhydantoinase B